MRSGREESPLKRKLTDLEEKFVKEANDGFFDVGYDENGAPYAIGAQLTKNLFSMEVKEVDYDDWGMYFLP